MAQEYKLQPKSNVVEFLIEHMTPKIKATYVKQLVVVMELITSQENVNKNVLLQPLRTFLEREVAMFFDPFQSSLLRIMRTKVHLEDDRM